MKDELQEKVSEDAQEELSSELPDLAIDPVAISLRLIKAPVGDTSPKNDDHSDPVTAAVDIIERQFSADISYAATDGTHFLRRFECHFMLENVLIVEVPDETTTVAIYSHARGAFILSKYLSAIAYTSEIGQNSFLLTYPECHKMFAPAVGWVTSLPERDSLPLEDVLRQYFQDADPQWEQLQPLKNVDVLSEGIESDAVAALTNIRDELEKKRHTLNHKSKAKDDVLEMLKDEKSILKGLIEFLEGSDDIDDFLYVLDVQTKEKS